MSSLFRPALLLLLQGLLLYEKANAQHNNNATIVYDINIKKNNGKVGIEETYNGGTKTVFVTKNKARIRLTALMRVQSIFLDIKENSLHKATVIKESGKSKYLFRLTPAQWKLYNKKYDNLACDTSFTDSLIILGYHCRKMIIKPENERDVTVYYTDSIKINNAVIEPLFRCINGAVLQYEVSTRKGTMTFKASQVSSNDIDPKIFTLPSKGITAKKYNPNKKPPKQTEIGNEDE